jgi:hypothetical protein
MVQSLNSLAPNLTHALIVLALFTQADQTRVRKVIIDLVLATDVSPISLLVYIGCIGKIALARLLLISRVANFLE